MKYTSAFEIIGPIMVGPSSYHTAGAVRIGSMARQLLSEQPRQVTFQLMGSFAEMEQGVAYTFTKGSAGTHHPNTVLILAAGATRSVKLLASSVPLAGAKQRYRSSMIFLSPLQERNQRLFFLTQTRKAF